MPRPLVSVRLITYNHEKYIAQCIEGVLMQKTDFPVEIIIGEDCSTDRTREIVYAYQQKYPEKIRLITSNKNVGGPQNVIRVQQACRGEYHAICEGDDYWIDPLKLQKQADFMEAHPECSMCCHNAFIIRDDRLGSPYYCLPPTLSSRLRVADFLSDWDVNVPTASYFARSEILSTLPSWRTELLNGDRLLRLWCAHHGDVAYMPDLMSVRNLHPGSMTDELARFPEKRLASTIYLLDKFDEETNYQYTQAIQNTKKHIGKEFNYLIHKKSLGWLALFLHPDRFLQQASNYMGALKQHNIRLRRF